MALRIAAGLTYVSHGALKTLGWFGGFGDSGTAKLMSEYGAARMIELVGGALIVLGLFTRPAALLASGEMAVAYFWKHWGSTHRRARELRELWPAEEAPDADVAAWMAALWGELPASPIYMALDDHERALEALRLFVGDLDYGPGTRILFAPTFDSLRDDPRFHDLMAGASLEGRRPRRVVASHN